MFFKGLKHNGLPGTPQDATLIGTIPNLTYTVGDSTTLDVSSYFDFETSFSLTGTLPTGITFNAFTGVFSINPSVTTASSSFTVVAAPGAVSSNVFTIEVLAASIEMDFFSTGTTTVSENVAGGVLNVPLKISGAPAGNSTIDWAITFPGANPASAADVTPLSGTATFLSGDTANVNIALTITDDALTEVTEALTITLSNPTNGTLGPNSTHDVNIIDDDTEHPLFDSPVTVGSQTYTGHPVSTIVGGGNQTRGFSVSFPKDNVPLTALNTIRVMRGGSEIAADVVLTTEWRELYAGASPKPNSVRSVQVFIEEDFPTAATKDVDIEWGGPVKTLDLNYAGTMESTWVLANTSGVGTSPNGHDFSNEYPIDYGINRSNIEASPDIYVMPNVTEPGAYYTTDAAWLCSCNVRSRMEPFGTHTDAWAVKQENYFRQHALGMVNDLTPNLLALGNPEVIDYISPKGLNKNNILSDGPNCWMFERPTMFWTNYMRSGDVYWMQRAHRASMWFRNGWDNTATPLDPAIGGQWLPVDPITNPPCNFLTFSASHYSNTHQLIDVILTGATPSEVMDVVSGCNDAHKPFTNVYAIGTSWTERLVAWKLHNSLTEWELTGDAGEETYVKFQVEELMDMQLNPKAGTGVYNGALKHSLNSHGEGFGTPEHDAIILGSPWMSTFLQMAMFRAYKFTQDSPKQMEMLNFQSNLGDYYVNDATFFPVNPDPIAGYTDGPSYTESDTALVIPGTGPGGSFRLPYYLASDTYQTTNNGWYPLNEAVHAHEILAAMVRSSWAKRQLGLDTTSIDSAVTDLKATAEAAAENFIFHDWKGTGEIFTRLNPPRQPLWQYNSAEDHQYLEND